MTNPTVLTNGSGKAQEKKKKLGNYLVVQWLGLHASTVGLQVQSLVKELRSHLPRGIARKQSKTNN